MKTIQEILDMDIHYGEAEWGGLYDSSLNLCTVKANLNLPQSKGFYYDIWTVYAFRDKNKYIYIV